MIPVPFEETIQAALAGDERAFARVWRQFNAPLQRYLRVVAASGDIEDLAAITWMEVVRGLERFSGGEAEFRAWLFTIARHRLYDQRRNQSRRARTVGSDELREGVDHASDPQVLTADAMATEAALAAIATLAPDQAEIVALRVIAGLDVAAVAELTGKKPGTVRVISHRGVKKLADLLAGDDDHPRGLRPNDAGNDRGPGGA